MIQKPEISLVNERAESLHWNEMDKNEKEELLQMAKLPKTFSRHDWSDLTFKAKEMLGKTVSKTTSKEFALVEDKMTSSQEKKREEIVLKLKKKKDEFKERYGDKWEEVMYATATKMAMKEENLAEYYAIKDREIGPNFYEATHTEETIDEEVDTQRYVRSHNKKPRGLGTWYFTIHRNGIDFNKHKEGVDYVKISNMKYAQAARKAEKMLGVGRRIFVGESANKTGIVEAKQKKYGFDLVKAGLKNNMPTGFDRSSDEKPLMIWLDKLEKELKKKGKSYDDVNPDDAIKLYYRDTKPNKAAKDLLSGKKIKESIDEELTVSLSFEFPDNKKAKQFAYDISNSSLGRGQVLGKKVEVIFLDNRKSTHKAVAKYMKKLKGKLIQESVVNEAGELQGDTTTFEFSIVQDAMDYAASLHKANIKHRKSGLKVEVVNAGGEAMSLAKKYNGHPVFNTEDASVTAGISGLDADTMGVEPGKTGDIQRRQEKMSEGIESAIRSYKNQRHKKLVDSIEGHPVFKVSSDEYASFSGSKGKKRFSRWNKSFKEDSKNGSSIKKYSLKNPKKPVIIQDEESGNLMYLRRRNNDSRMKHNRRAKDV